MGRVPLQRRSVSVCSFGRRTRQVSQRTSRPLLWGRSTESGGGGGQDRTDAEAESRAGRRLTMCPLGRTPLIPLQLEINESLILHPLPLSLSPILFLYPTIMSFSVDDLVASLSGNHIGQEAIDLAALQVPFISRSPINRPAAELILDLPPVSTLSIPLLSSAGDNVAP